MKTINFGIDLGTTNSAVAKFNKGKVSVYNNPSDYGRSTLPSVIQFKGHKVVVGTKAKAGKFPVSLFKRKMGTTDAVNGKTPVELSSIILKELKGFVSKTGDTMNSAVITIPSSFDTIQSNATLEAGKQAGFSNVVLLQEPIAASLAYANSGLKIEDGKWLVYDLGGGTFDVALLEIKDGEMKVLDHEGNNFQGGADYDALIVDNIVIPALEKKYSFTNLEKELKDKKGKYFSEYPKLLALAEQAKIELSNNPSTEISVVDILEDNNNNEVDLDITITKSDFDALIKPSVEKTVKMVGTIFTRNNLSKIDVEFVLMVGGSTFIPQVRERVKESLDIEVRTDIDPTTAVATGAAFYAGTKEDTKAEKQASENKYGLKVKTVYNKASKESEELFSAKVEGKSKGMSYRITRNDNGYDSGINKINGRIAEDLPLVADTYNHFTFTITNETADVLFKEDFAINSGFAVSGQPIPEAICLEIDDIDSESTKLLVVFEKNTVLPTKRKMAFPITKPVLKGDSSSSFLINVFEGSQDAIPESNKPIANLVIKGADLHSDISAGSEIELSFSMDESRTLTVEAYLVQADQEVKEVFNPKERETNVDTLKNEVSDLYVKLDDELAAAEENENFEACTRLREIKHDMSGIVKQTNALTTDDSTDKKFQLEDEKRKIAQAIDNATKGKKVNLAIAKYKETKENTKEKIRALGNDSEQRKFDKIVSREESTFSTKSISRINQLENEMDAIYSEIEWRNPEFLGAMLGWLIKQQTRMNDQQAAISLISRAERAYKNREYTVVADINRELFSLLPRQAAEGFTAKIGFGI